MLIVTFIRSQADCKSAQMLRLQTCCRGKQIALDVARGLAYLHTHAHVLHLDLKSQNILLAKDGTAKIADAGKLSGSLAMLGAVR